MWKIAKEGKVNMSKHNTAISDGRMQVAAILTRLCFGCAVLLCAGAVRVYADVPDDVKDNEALAEIHLASREAYMKGDINELKRLAKEHKELLRLALRPDIGRGPRRRFVLSFAAFVSPTSGEAAKVVGQLTDSTYKLGPLFDLVPEGAEVAYLPERYHRWLLDIVKGGDKYARRRAMRLLRLIHDLPEDTASIMREIVDSTDQDVVTRSIALRISARANASMAGWEHAKALFMDEDTPNALRGQAFLVLCTWKDGGEVPGTAMKTFLKGRFPLGLDNIVMAAALHRALPDNEVSMSILKEAIVKSSEVRLFRHIGLLALANFEVPPGELRDSLRNVVTNPEEDVEVKRMIKSYLDYWSSKTESSEK